MDSTLSAFSYPDRHAAVSDLIRRHSTNPADVREVALRGLDLRGMHRVLDVGCGFGFMAEAVAARLAPDAEIVGVDACAANEDAFLLRVRAHGIRAQFIRRQLERQLDWPDATFDLVLASYALYFFPAVLAELPRVMKPHGLLLAVTHTESSCAALLNAVGLPADREGLMPIIRAFSVENAERQLRPLFREVQRVDYTNTLVFDHTHVEDLLAHVRFKLPLLLPAAPPRELPPQLAATVRAALAPGGQVRIEKNDAAFRCRGPRCH
jgi:SAM-dependent methyltransferase